MAYLFLGNNRKVVTSIPPLVWAPVISFFTILLLEEIKYCILILV